MEDKINSLKKQLSTRLTSIDEMIKSENIRKKVMSDEKKIVDKFFDSIQKKGVVNDDVILKKDLKKMSKQYANIRLRTVDFVTSADPAQLEILNSYEKRDHLISKRRLFEGRVGDKYGEKNNKTTNNNSKKIQNTFSMKDVNFEEIWTLLNLNI